MDFGPKALEAMREKMGKVGIAPEEVAWYIYRRTEEECVENYKKFLAIGDDPDKEE